MMNTSGAKQEMPVALITGASSGTGREIALTLASEGYRVALAGRRLDALNETAACIIEAGGTAQAFAFDLMNEQAVADALGAVLEWSDRRIDVLVNAAAIPGAVEVPIGKLPIAEFDAMISTNLRGPFLTMTYLLPVMIERGYGRIINIGGNHGMRGRAGRVGYTSSKWGLRGLTRCAALEAGRSGVTVNYIAPGPIAVDRMKRGWAERGRRDGVDTSTAVARYTAEMGPALGKLNEPWDIAAMVSFLASEGGRNITGQELVIDGGIVV
ncbi:NAD(P)-dependent dehydrogenase (short-subunit alcohol dehydrogenase family) [Paraburkholderia sp. GAS38]|uniref:SDR family NAD(P)-dependent oxidoreductase n=1 Tax=Paraburkholderia sp. GAS38 TaxID=3035133 RepID=UPI003D1ABB4C